MMVYFVFTALAVTGLCNVAKRVFNFLSCFSPYAMLGKTK